MRRAATQAATSALATAQRTHGTGRGLPSAQEIARHALANDARYVVGLLEHEERRWREIIAEARDYVASDPRGRRPNAAALVYTARALVALGRELEAKLDEFVEEHVAAWRPRTGPGTDAA